MRLLFILFFLFIGYNSMSQTEEQSYSVLKTLEDVQIREYDPVIYATVSTDNERSLFRILAGYIFGGNESNQKIAMTAPVHLPETLIEKKRNNIITKPIAGTLKKNKKTSIKSAYKYFKNNIKETKEHNMIVDMERNDLSRICKPGSVIIRKEKYVEEYKHLYHYVTSIVGKINKNVKIKDIIKSMMPGGSVIGCPKIKTLQLLNEQENEERNIFTGSFGYIKFNKDMRFNLIIRSILNYKNFSEISAASGVVLDSQARKEFNENYIKAKSLLELFK